MWQLEIEATYASSGSTFAAFDHGAGTTEGEGDAGTVKPPSKPQVCSREYFPLTKSGLVRFHFIVATCVLIGQSNVASGNRSRMVFLTRNSSSGRSNRRLMRR